MRTPERMGWKPIFFILAASLAGAGRLPAAPFVRGDVDGNRSLGITDALLVLGHLFLGDPSALPCAGAADTDDSGSLDVSDAIYLLNFEFLGGSPPPAPFPHCGLDPTEDRLGCERFEACFCGGIAGFPCDKGEVCDLEPGLCQGADLGGTCVRLPEVCPDVFDPVCGCDGVTYGNDCERLRAGVQKDYDGECRPVCGGRGIPPCPDGFYCEFPPGTCGAADEPGVCTPIGPGICPLFFDPVCGCDGVTYSNDCFRRAAGISKSHDGPCEGTICGGIAGEPCPEGFYCEYPEGTSGEGDIQGICGPLPQACPKNFDPVCGCDQKTYGNDCERTAAGVALKHRGPCAEGGSPVLLDTFDVFGPGTPTPLVRERAAAPPGLRPAGGPGVLGPEELPLALQLRPLLLLRGTRTSLQSMIPFILFPPSATMPFHAGLIDDFLHPPCGAPRAPIRGG